MKKLVLVLLLVGIVSSLVFSGCATPASTPAPSSPASAPKATPAAAPQTKTLTVVGGVAGGPSLAVVMAMAEMWTNLVTKPYKVNVMAEPLVAMEENLKRLDRGEVNLAWSANTFAYCIANGINMYKPYGKRNFYTLYWSTSNLFHIATLDMNIKSIKDMKGKRISGSRPGATPVEEATLALLAANGLTKDDIKLITHTTNDDAFRQLKEDVADVGMTYMSFPSASLVELSASRKVNFISLSEDEINAIKKSQPWIIRSVMPAGTYKGQEKDVLGVGACEGIFTRLDFDETLAYEMTKAIYDNLPKFVTYHAACKLWDAQSATKIWIFPYHPGAIKYFKEKGIWTAEHDARQKELLAAAAAK